MTSKPQANIFLRENCRKERARIGTRSRHLDRHKAAGDKRIKSLLILRGAEAVKRAPFWTVAQEPNGGVSCIARVSRDAKRNGPVSLRRQKVNASLMFVGRKAMIGDVLRHNVSPCRFRRGPRLQRDNASVTLHLTEIDNMG